MCIFKAIGAFVTNGFSTLESASKGKYTQETEVIKILKKEIVESLDGNIQTDKRKLSEDKKAICNDVQTALEKLIIDNG